MSYLELYQHLHDKGYSPELCDDGSIMCCLPKPFENFGFTTDLIIKDGVISLLDCAVWESYAGSVIAQAGFGTVKDMVFWATMHAVGCELRLSEEIAEDARFS